MTCYITRITDIGNINTFLGSCEPDNEGREFILAFMESSRQDDDIELQFYAGPLNDRDIEVTIQSGDRSVDDTVRIRDNESAFYTVRSEIRSTGTGKADNGILITATDNIVVFVLNEDEPHCAGSVILPISSLRSSYFAATWQSSEQRDDQYSQVVIVSTANRNRITVELPDRRDIEVYWERERETYRRGQQITLELDSSETFQVNHLYSY